MLMKSDFLLTAAVLAKQLHISQHSGRYCVISYPMYVWRNVNVWCTLTYWNIFRSQQLQKQQQQISGSIYKQHSGLSQGVERHQKLRLRVLVHLGCVCIKVKEACNVRSDWASDQLLRLTQWWLSEPTQVWQVCRTLPCCLRWRCWFVQCEKQGAVVILHNPCSVPGGDTWPVRDLISLNELQRNEPCELSCPGECWTALHWWCPRPVMGLTVGSSAQCCAMLLHCPVTWMDEAPSSNTGRGQLSSVLHSASHSQNTLCSHRQTDKQRCSLFPRGLHWSCQSLHSLPYQCCLPPLPPPPIDPPAVECMFGWKCANIGEYTLIKGAELQDRSWQKPLVTDGRLLVSERERAEGRGGVSESCLMNTYKVLTYQPLTHKHTQTTNPHLYCHQSDSLRVRRLAWCIVQTLTVWINL